MSRPDVALLRSLLAIACVLVRACERHHSVWCALATHRSPRATLRRGGGEAFFCRGAFFFRPSARPALWARGHPALVDAFHLRRGSRCAGRRSASVKPRFPAARSRSAPSAGSGAGGSKFKVSLGLNVAARINCADNSGAKNLFIIAVGGWGCRLNRLPRAAIGDMVLTSVKKGKPELKKTVHAAIVIRQRKSFRRKNGTFIYFEGESVWLLGGGFFVVGRGFGAVCL